MTSADVHAGLPDGMYIYCHTKILNLGTFGRALEWEMFGKSYVHLESFVAIVSILCPLRIFCGHLINFVVVWYIFSCFGILCPVKSGNPAVLHSLWLNEPFNATKSSFCLVHTHIQHTKQQLTKNGSEESTKTNWKNNLTIFYIINLKMNITSRQLATQS
jgi:hypothetical protein